MRKKNLLAMSLLAFIALSACSAPKQHFYAVKVAAAPKASAAPLTQATIAVQRFRGNRAYDQERLIYRENNEINFYEYHRWTNSPIDMTVQAVISQLQSANYFKQVAAYRDAPEADFLLTGRVDSFEEVDSASGVTASVKFELSLIVSKTREQIWTGYGEAELPVSPRTQQGVAQALENALNASVKQAAQGLGRQLQQMKPQ